MASGTTKSVEVVLPIVSSPTPTPKLKRKRATYFDDFEVSPVQTSSEHVLGREHDAFEPSAVNPGSANSTLSVDTLEQLPPPPNCRDVLIFLWRSRLPIGSTRAIPREIDSVPHHFWWGDHHDRTCNCCWCNVLFGVGPEREHV